VNTEITRGLLAAVGLALDFPAVAVGGVTVADRGAWEYALANSTPVERERMLAALEPALLEATPGGRERLATTCCGDADEEPYFVGDPELLAIVRTALAFVPPTVSYPLIREVAFLGVGVSSRAWTAVARHVDAVGRRKGRIIALGPRADMATTLHELADAHLAGPPSEDALCITAQGEAGLSALAESEGWRERIDCHVARGEVLADALALVWLYSIHRRALAS
jgi:hypothetical protein